MLRLLLASGYVLLATAGGTAVRPTWKLMDGESFYLEEVTTMKSVTVHDGKKYTQEQQQLRVWNLVVKKRVGDNYVLEAKILSWKSKSTGDGADSNENNVAAMEQGTKDVPFTFEVTPAGSMGAFDGYKQLLKKLSKENAELARNFEQLGGDELFRLTLYNVFDILPENPVKTGESWKRDTYIAMGSLGTIKNTATFTLATIGDDGLNISGKANMSFQPRKVEPGELGVKFLKVELSKNESSSRIVFDKARGRLVSYQMQMPIAGTWVLEAQGQKFTFEIDAQWTQTIRLLDKKPAADLK
jgi:hypothetical protein